MKKVFFITSMSLFTVFLSGQSANDILNVLVDQRSISQDKADSLRAEYAIKQQTILPDKKFRLDAEVRPRAEYRNGYQQLRNDSSTAAVFVNQRFRLSASYVFDNRISLQFSVQDLRVWGQQDPRSTAATLQVFEGWIEPYLISSISIRVGRQRLMFDNQRLFAENDWRLNAAVHDAVDFRINRPNLVSDLAFAFNQSSERYFGTDYAPAGFKNYKFLAVNYLRYKPNKVLSFTTLNSTDGYQDKNNSEDMFFRYTLGGRIEVDKSGIYGTLSGFYQGGKNSSGIDLSAWYLQPEIRFSTAKGLVSRLGAEIFSGDDNYSPITTDHSFVPLYGVAHRFNGSMDLITKFPGDAGGAGLVNPYLFITQSLAGKFELRADFHSFHLVQNYYKDDIRMDGYLGFENDFLFTYKPNSITKLDLGISYMIPTETFEAIKESGDSKYNLSWVYLSLTIRPQLLGLNFK